MNDNPLLPPRISIIIPVFNDAEGVVNCLRSIAAQSYPPTSIEAIVVDNGSQPPLALEEHFPFNLKVLHHSKPGSYAARNAGVAAASGQVLAFIDADCWPSVDWLSFGVMRLLVDEDNCIVGGEVTFAMPADRTAVSLYQLASGFGQKENIAEKHFSATANLICSRSTFALIGNFEERLLSGGDREWCWRAISRGVNLIHEPRAVVYTLPRRTLRSSIRQARRVAAGRAALRKLHLGHMGTHSIARRRSGWQSLKWVLSQHSLSQSERIRVLFVAAVIRAASYVESFRLVLGGSAERR